MMTIFTRIYNCQLDIVSKQFHLKNIDKTFVGIACDGNMGNTVEM